MRANKKIMTWTTRVMVTLVLTMSIGFLGHADESGAKIVLESLCQSENIPHESLYSTCEVFQKCRSVKQVCYREILKKHGEDKWYYPDTMCPKCSGN